MAKTHLSPATVLLFEEIRELLRSSVNDIDPGDVMSICAFLMGETGVLAGRTRDETLDDFRALIGASYDQALSDGVVLGSWPRYEL